MPAVVAVPVRAGKVDEDATGVKAAVVAVGGGTSDADVVEGTELGILLLLLNGRGAVVDATGK